MLLLLLLVIRVWCGLRETFECSLQYGGFDVATSLHCVEVFVKKKIMFDILLIMIYSLSLCLCVRVADHHHLSLILQDYLLLLANCKCTFLIVCIK